MSLNIKNYNDTVDYLYGLRRHGIKLGLENPRKLMRILGEPQKSFRSIHIAGTNGKGSTAAIIASVLKENGLKTGIYTSPHLVSFTERIRVNNKEIAEHEVVELTDEIRNIIQDTPSLITLPHQWSKTRRGEGGQGRAGSELQYAEGESNSVLNPTFFEFVTAMAFLYFKRKKVDWAVVETGMGGRLDATNVLLPEVSVITNIDLDHNEYLGKTRFNIAFEKAGIIKPLRPVVTGTSHPEALRILKNTAKDHGSELHIYDKDFKGSLIFMDDKHIIFDYAGAALSETHTNKYREYKNLSLSATGRHQIYNASLAIRVIEILEQRGIRVSDRAVINGLSNINFEGRFEIISHAPLIIIDSAHNPAASRVLADTVKELFPAKNIILMAGIMKDKDIKGILEPLIQISDTAILTKPKGSRAAPPKKLEDHIKTLNASCNSQFMPKSIITTDSVAEALDIAKTFRYKDSVVLVTGSFYTTGEVKELLGRSTGVLSQLRE